LVAPRVLCALCHCSSATAAPVLIHWNALKIERIYNYENLSIYLETFNIHFNLLIMLEKLWTNGVLETWLVRPAIFYHYHAIQKSLATHTNITSYICLVLMGFYIWIENCVYVVEYRFFFCISFETFCCRSHSLSFAFRWLLLTNFHTFHKLNWIPERTTRI